MDGRAYRPYWSPRTRLVRLLEEGTITAMRSPRGEDAELGCPDRPWRLAWCGQRWRAHWRPPAAGRNVESRARVVCCPPNDGDRRSAMGAHRHRTRPDPQDGQDPRDHRPADAGRVVPGGVGAPGRFRARQSSTTAGLRLHAGGQTSAVAGRHGPATDRTREKPVRRSDQLLQQCRAIAARALTDDRLLVLRNKAIKPRRRSTPPPSPGATTQNRSRRPLPSHPSCMKGVSNELGLAA
jgi:hypothetical protein